MHPNSTHLIQALYQSVTDHGDREAVVHARKRISYSELWNKIKAATQTLESHNIGPGDRVALLMENSAEYIACYYGTLARGATVIACNTHSIAREVNNWISHSKAKLLFVDRSYPEFAKIQGQTTVVPVDANSFFAPAGAASFSFVFVPPAESLAAVIYTSGTTGHPKGIMLSHQNLSANTKAIIKYLGLTEKDRALNLLPFYYSYGNSVLHSHLSVGATLVLENSLAFPHHILKQFSQEKITGFPAVSTTLAILFGSKQLDTYDFSSLRYLTQAGGAISAQEVLHLQERLPKTEIYLMYGQTEATARLSYLPPVFTKSKPHSVGIPIEGIELQIRGAENTEIVTGETGEIYARGTSIMMGYLNDSEATQKVLKHGWLRTGDMGKKDEAGHLTVLGRNSEFIKSGAHRVNPLEIEEIIAELAAVKEVAVFAKADPLLGQAIAAAVVLQNNTTLSPLEIKAHCRTRLPLHKIPKHVAFLTELPRTSSGKAKRLQLTKDFFA